MRCFVAVCVAALGSTIAVAQSPAAAGEMQGARIIATKTDWPTQGHCGKKHFEWARLSLDVADDGTPQAVEFNDASRPDVKDLAMAAVREDRFAPAEQDGKPVKEHGVLLVEMDTCAEKVKQPDGKMTEQVWTEVPPKQTFWPAPTPSAIPRWGVDSGPHNSGRSSGRVSAPVPVVQPVAEFTSQAKKEQVQGEVIVTLMVDANGMPQNPRVIKPLPAGLTQAALEAVRKYRFRPATRDGQPVPAMITIAVNFRLY